MSLPLPKPLPKPLLLPLPLPLHLPQHLHLISTQALLVTLRSENGTMANAVSKVSAAI